MAMSELILTREEVRAVDRWAVATLGIPGTVLMENAGRGCAELLCRRIQDKSRPTVICCGKGNNGGDGFVIARHLRIAGLPVEVLVFHDPSEFQGDALANLTILRKIGIPCRRLQLPEDRSLLDDCLRSADWVVDALLGTGSQGAPRSPYDIVIEALNACDRPVLAVDVPSGLDCDTGVPSPSTVRAAATVTFAALKPAFALETARQWAGSVTVAHIGIPPGLLAAWRIECQTKSNVPPLQDA